MSRAEVISSFAAYEIKRAVARRKVLVLVAFTVLLDTLPYYVLSTVHSGLIPLSAYPYIWIVGVFAAAPLFLNFTAILIAAGAMSEEYEQGTAELLLSKPVHRSDYFIGKFLGGYLLFLAILGISIFLGVASAYAAFGMQLSLYLIPGLFLAQAFSSLLFYTIAFMLGELIRRSSLAYIFSSAVFFSSLIISVYLDLIYTLTGNAFYRTVQIYLPTSPTNSLPQLYIFPRLPQSIGSIIRLVGGARPVVPTIELSVALVMTYFVVAVAVAAAYFLRADISRKVS